MSESSFESALLAVWRQSLVENVRSVTLAGESYPVRTTAKQKLKQVDFRVEGRGVWTVNGKTFEGSAGDIFVIKAGEVHSFKAVGDSPLIQVDVHLSPQFIQENL